jgi:hypothetical protein
MKSLLCLCHKTVNSVSYILKYTICSLIVHECAVPYLVYHNVFMSTCSRFWNIYHCFHLGKPSGDGLNNLKIGCGQFCIRKWLVIVITFTIFHIKFGTRDTNTSWKENIVAGGKVNMQQCVTIHTSWAFLLVCFNW